MKITPASIRFHWGGSSAKSVRNTPKNNSQSLRDNGKKLDIKG